MKQDFRLAALNAVAKNIQINMIWNVALEQNSLSEAYRIVDWKDNPYEAGGREHYLKGLKAFDLAISAPS